MVANRVSSGAPQVENSATVSEQARLTVLSNLNRMGGTVIGKD